eukprot:Gb_06395 [translate_table: standard]
MATTALRLRRSLTLLRAFSTSSSSASYFTAHSSSHLALKSSSSSPTPLGYGHLSGFSRPSPPSRYLIARCRVSNSGNAYSPLDNGGSSVLRQPLFEGCDYEHWLITMEFPEPQPSREEKIEAFVNTLANVVGSVEEAKKRIYALSTTTYCGFMCKISEELSEKCKSQPGVVWVLPDSYADPIKKTYGVGDLYDNGVITPDTRVFNNRSSGRYNDRPRDRIRARRDSMPVERREPLQIERRDPMPTEGRDSMQGDRRDFRPMEGRDNMQGDRRDFRPMEGRGPMQGGRQDYRPPMEGRGSMQGDGQDYRPPPMGERRDYMPPVGGRDPAPGERRDYMPPNSVQGERRDTMQMEQGYSTQGERANPMPTERRDTAQQPQEPFPWPKEGAK